jgi:hypothetical protein
MHSAGFVVRNFRRILRELSPSQKTERIGMAIEFEQVFESAKHRAWWYSLTGDESWFCYTINHNYMWILDGEEVPTRPRRTIASPKRMLVDFWSPLGLSFVQILPKGTHFDFHYFCSNILSAIVQNQLSETPEDWRRRMSLHFNNPTMHAAKCPIDYLRANRLTRVPYPAFSADLAPSDFYLFGKMKMVLMGAASPDDGPLQGVMEVLNGILREGLEAVFEECLRR